MFDNFGEVYRIESVCQAYFDLKIECHETFNLLET